MKVYLKRFRIVLYFLAASLAVILYAGTSEEISGVLSAAAAFVLIPGFMISLIWAAYTTIRDVYYVKKGIKTQPEDKPIWIVRLYHKIRDAGSRFKSRTKAEKKRIVIYCTVSASVCVLGLLLLIAGLVTIGTCVLTGGTALWLLSSPESYNKYVEGVTMYFSPKNSTAEGLYEAFKNVNTPYGTPYIARIRTLLKYALIFGPDLNGLYIYIYFSGNGQTAYLVKGRYPFIIGKQKKGYERRSVPSFDGLSLPENDIDQIAAEIGQMLDTYFAEGKERS